MVGPATIREGATTGYIPDAPGLLKPTFQILPRTDEYAQPADS